MYLKNQQPYSSEPKYAFYDLNHHKLLNIHSYECNETQSYGVQGSTKHNQQIFTLELDYEYVFDWYKLYKDNELTPKSYQRDIFLVKDNYQCLKIFGAYPSDMEYYGSQETLKVTLGQSYIAQGDTTVYPEIKMLIRREKLNDILR